MDVNREELLKDLARYLHNEFLRKFINEVSASISLGINKEKWLNKNGELDFEDLPEFVQSDRLSSARDLMTIIDTHYGVSLSRKYPPKLTLIEMDVSVGYGAVQTKLGFFDVGIENEAIWYLILDSGHAKLFDYYNQVIIWRPLLARNLWKYPRKIYTGYDGIEIPTIEETK